MHSCMDWYGRGYSQVACMMVSDVLVLCFYLDGPHAINTLDCGHNDVRCS